MVVVAIIGILAEITILWFIILSRKGEEGATKGGRCDSQCPGIFQCEYSGVWPGGLSILVPEYLNEIPTVNLGAFFDLSNNVDTLPAVLNNNDGDRSYDTNDGFVWVDCISLDTRGEVISTW